MKEYLAGSFYCTLLGLWILSFVIPLTAVKPSSTIDNYPSLMSLCQCLVNAMERIYMELYSLQVDNGNKDYYENGQLVQTSVPLELYFEPGSTYPSEQSKRFLIYCTAPPKTEFSTSSDVRDWLKSNYLIWTVPLQKDVWICLLVLLTSFSIFISRNGRKQSVYHLPTTFLSQWLGIFSLLLHQYTRVSNLDDKIVMVLAVAGMVIAWMYENMLTSSVTVPLSEEKVIEDLKELVERNYKILWCPKIDPLNPLMLYESSFKAAGLSDRINDAFIAVKDRFPDPANVAKHIRLTSYKRATITDGKIYRYLKRDRSEWLLATVNLPL
ncbi:unnamed protein product [Orchesella dallaii]|uniref:Uncharacterized protein n=1 Tax=Orchesella dallaii TaxID=48710 RepID=A0ABP1R696_9HEXA